MDAASRARLHHVTTKNPNTNPPTPRAMVCHTCLVEFLPIVLSIPFWLLVYIRLIKRDRRPIREIIHEWNARKQY
jgi:hypothetical protein